MAKARASTPADAVWFDTAERVLEVEYTDREFVGVVGSRRGI